ncbi:MAG: alpha-glucan family phosphorylase [Planctomycetota bacterium]
MTPIPRPGFLYSVSWEVCNRIGGVYTVLETAAPHLVSGYGGNVLYVGPDLWSDRTAQAYFVEDRNQPQVAAVAAEHDVPVRFGHCEIEGEPRVALIDFGRLLESKNAILGELWEEFGVDSIHADWDTIERLLFGYAAGRLLELHYRLVVKPRGLRAVAHFHQWQAAAGILRLGSTTPEVGTVFTPHGTALGRTLASSGLRIDRVLDTIEPDQAARDQKVQTAHSLERAAAKHAAVLSTVSEHAAEEAHQLLDREPDLITPNGYHGLQPVDAERRIALREDILERASRFLGTRLDPKTTQVAITASRYEYRNKGIPLILDALGRLVSKGESPKRKMLLIVAVSAPQTGPKREVLDRLAREKLAGEPCGVATHNLAHPEDDPILAGCREYGLENRPGDAAYVMFVPVRLEGHDSVLPYTYEEVLKASDTSIFPSLYEPWGYTPVESLAAGVPTVTTDLTGFGRFLLEREEEEHTGVLVLPVASASDQEVEELFDRAILRYLDAESDAEIERIRAASADVLERVRWEKLIGRTLEAHELALERSGEARRTLVSPSLAGRSRRAVISLPARRAARPQLHRFQVTAVPPEGLHRLVELAKNLWWSWNPDAYELFGLLDADRLVQLNGNPVRLLAELPPETLARAAADAGYRERCRRVFDEFERYTTRKKRDMPSIAYFCAEFALHESLPIYSGGLGVLAGDHLKSASDLRLPFTAVGLRYADGYFNQRIERDGRQTAMPQHRDPRTLPMTEVLDDEGNPLRIRLEMPEHDLFAGAWRVDVGQIQLFLLDTNVPENDEGNRGLTAKLYPSEREWRLRQEILLGVGGWRLLRALHRAPDVCHLNEGHSSFLLLERVRALVEEQGLTFAEACVLVRGNSLFTTHTPVPAGHDRFHEELMRRYFAGPAARIGLDWEEFFDLGRTSEEDDEFSMTTLALRLTGRANGVSALHGRVSRNMLAETWPGLPEAETPVQSVTNGVHLPTWCGPVLRPVLNEKLGLAWREEETSKEDWARVGDLSDADIWRLHAAQKERMIHAVRLAIEKTSLRRGTAPSVIRHRLAGLREDALVIGYARRFAPYKRATLLFRDVERLRALLDDELRPVRIVYAGKAHPDDGEGGSLVREIVGLSEDPRFEGKVFFVENYDMEIARELVQGVDVWLNTPTRPLEASGTSGMKAAFNGALHASILDTNGFAIGDSREHDDPELQAEYDSRSLYRVMESEMIPEYFDRDASGLPTAWIERMRRSMTTVPAFFSTHRMVTDYSNFGYKPLGAAHERLEANDFGEARAIAARKEKLERAWRSVQIDDLSVTDASGGSLGLGETFDVEASIRIGDLEPDDVVVELFIGQTDENGELVEPTVLPLARKESNDNVSIKFAGGYMPSGAGSFQYGVRVRPRLDDEAESNELGLIQWA